MAEENEQKPLEDFRNKCSASIGGEKCGKKVYQGGLCRACYNKRLQSKVTARCVAEGEWQGEKWTCVEPQDINSTTGYCRGHLRQTQRGTTLRPLGWNRSRHTSGRKCTAEGDGWKCGNTHYAKDLCRAHYKWRRYNPKKSFQRVAQDSDHAIDEGTTMTDDEVQALGDDEVAKRSKLYMHKAALTGNVDLLKFNACKAIVERAEGKAASQKAKAAVVDIPRIEIRVMALDPDATLDHVVPADDG